MTWPSDNRRDPGEPADAKVVAQRKVIRDFARPTGPIVMKRHRVYCSTCARWAATVVDSCRIVVRPGGFNLRGCRVLCDECLAVNKSPGVNKPPNKSEECHE